MATQTQHLDIEAEGSGNVVRVRLRGELDMLTAPQLLDVLERLVLAGQRLMILDMAEVRFMDRAGLAVIAAVAHDQAHRSVLGVTGCSPSVRRVFELTGQEALVGADRLSTLAACELRGGGGNGRSDAAIEAESS
jgi:anti-anti-sigma factor